MARLPERSHHARARHGARLIHRRCDFPWISPPGGEESRSRVPQTRPPRKVPNVRRLTVVRDGTRGHPRPPRRTNTRRHTGRRPGGMGRALPAPRTARLGRNGRGLARRAVRAPAKGGPQADQGGDGHPRGGGPIRVRAAGPGPDGPPGHRPGVRRRKHAGGPAVLRDGVRAPAFRSPSTATRQRLSTVERLAALRRGLRGRPARAPEGDHPPRSQAVEHPGLDRQDGKACPKIIDFGIAKATGQRADREDALHAGAGRSSAPRRT